MSGEMVWPSRGGSRMVPALQQDTDSFQELHRRRCWAVAGAEQSHSLPAYELPFFCQYTPKNVGI